MLDERDAYTPGWKFAEWELRGVPLRLEIGPKDIEKSQVMLARRDTREKLPTPIDGLTGVVQTLLAEIQAGAVRAGAAVPRRAHDRTSSYEEFKRIMEGRPGFVVAPWCGSDECEAQIKAETQATIRNIPHDSAAPDGPCIKCDRPATASGWFAKAY